MHGIDADHGGEEGGESGDPTDVIALGLQGAADATIDRGAHLGEFHVQDCAVAAGFGGFDGGPCDGEGVAAGVGILTGNGAGLEQGFHAVGFALGAQEAGFGLGHGRIRHIKTGLFKAGIDLE